MVLKLGSFNESFITFKAWWMLYILLILSIKKLHFIDSVFICFISRLEQEFILINLSFFFSIMETVFTVS